MQLINVDDYKEERSCTYKNEEYLVRDNGAILRKSRPNQRKRKDDDKWLFGKIDFETKYLFIGQHRVHIIVAIAFLGDPPTNEHVVDHIDTNRQNNRPENLRWLTRFENVVINKATREKIEYRIGTDISDFLKDPAKYRHLLEGSNFDWMRRVTEDEAKACLERFESLNKKPSSVNAIKSKLDEWVYKKKHIDLSRAVEIQPHCVVDHDKSNRKAEISESLSPLAVQENWKTPTDFVCCPAEIATNPMKHYMDRIVEGGVFFVNRYGSSSAEKSMLTGDNKILVMTFDQKQIKPFGLLEIRYENGHYVHKSLGTFFTDIGAEKHYTIAQGLEWMGEDSIDDYC